MSNFNSREEREEIEELMRMYDNLKLGRNASFINEEDFERIVEHLEDKEDFREAYKASALALEYFPFATFFMLRKADYLIDNQRFTEAMAILDRVELLDQNDISLYILKTDCLLGQEMHEKAALVLEEALNRFSGEERLDLLAELAEVYEDYQDFDKVFECLRMILMEDPTNDEALLRIGFWAEFSGNNEASIRLHQHLVDETPYNEMAWFNLGSAFQGLKLYEKAIDAYKFALAIDDKMDIAWRNMSDAFIRQRKYKDAIESLQKVLEISRPEDIIYEAIGHCFHKLGNFAQARLYYRKSSHINPEDSHLYYKIAHTYYKEQKYIQAIRQLEHALMLSSKHMEFYLLMGDCYMELNDLSRAADCYAAVVERKPKSMMGNQSYIFCLLLDNRHEDALFMSRLAFANTNQNPVFYYYIAASLLALGKTKEGLIELESGLVANPKGFRKMFELFPGILKIPRVIDLVNQYLKKGSKPGKKNKKNK